MHNVQTGGEGVQVLFVEEDGTYRVDEAALRRVALHEAARGLPVAVVSVAGATRGGKSFLLDFFLRYLRAPETARRTGAWIGADDEPLTGFAWRGGCERDTQGIIIWSEPIIITVGTEGTSEKVAVVLMDTQGTFDSTSTVRDSSTIFAMSTLLSSVQIYNLSQNIKEDDLQYLQLFTEYGKLARDEEVGIPFQVLQFLVRDWSYAYEHPVGAEGGQQLLDKRLEIRSEQAEELRQIRQHVRSAFECVRCFLLPHPGLTVATNPHFRGCNADISSEFKNGLKTLAPSLFGPENMILKMVNGQKITFPDLADYFITYVKIFNSDVLPTPTTVMQATSRASLEVAIRASRDAYCSHMEALVRSGGGSVRREAVPRAHEAALLAAREAFAKRRTLAAPALAQTKLDDLLQDLDAMLPHYTAINNANILGGIAASKVAYDDAMCEQRCLSNEELTARHNAQVAAAREAFYATRGEPSEDNEEDDDWKTLEKDLEQLLPLHRERNSERIACAYETAREAYAVSMRDGLAAAPCLHPAALSPLHATARDTAITGFLNNWTDHYCSERDEHKAELLNYIEEKLQEFQNENDRNNEEALKKSLDFYDTRMSDFFKSLGSLCVHPNDLAVEQERAVNAAVARFTEMRAPLQPRTRYARDSFTHTLITVALPKLFSKFKELNEVLNNTAVKKAHEYYVSKICPNRVGGEGVLELLGPPDLSVLKHHEPVLNEAIEHFRASRRVGRHYSKDEHLDDLKKKIQKTYVLVIFKFVGNIGLAALNVAAMASMVFVFKR